MYKVVMLRHGESLWNLENKFTGWVDIKLSENGKKEGLEAAATLKKEGFAFDMSYTSVLSRSIQTLNIILEEMGLLHIPVERSWRLNERHYGALQGLDKVQTVEKYGEEQVKIWRRSYDTPPPALSDDDKMHPSLEPRYKLYPKDALPKSECLKDTVNRVLPYWEDVIAPQIKSGKQIIIAAHGNSLRSLIKHLDKMSDEEIVEYNVPTAVPLVFELDKDLRPIKKHYYLGDPAVIQAKMDAVKNQTKKK